MSTNTRFSVSRAEYARMTTTELRSTFLVEALFQPGQINLTYWETDRSVLGAAVPLDEPLTLEAPKEVASAHFCERRELGILNLGEAGAVIVDGTTHQLAARDLLYVGRGARDISFISAKADAPARFFLVSYPAHVAHPTTRARQNEAKTIKLGSPETANQRTIYQYVHEEGVKSCQLVMGYTQLEPGSVWNTMPPHTHLRRSEIYLYFTVPENQAVVHLMGPGEETRHLIVHNEQAVLSPIWSIHSGCGTAPYAFVWAMGGENQVFADMDGIPVNALQ